MGEATLVVFVRDTEGKPVESCDVVIRRLRIGTRTDAQGKGIITRCAPGTWAVTWKAAGAPGDSARVSFVASRVETLNVTVRYESETPNPYEEPRR